MRYLRVMAASLAHLPDRLPPRYHRNRAMGSRMLGKCYRVFGPVLLLVLGLLGEARAGLYEDGDAAFRRKDYPGALEHWRPLANAGDARAQLGLAMMYYAGHGVVLDYAEAFDWCSKAADQDVPQAYYMLAAMYRDGKGAVQDHSKAVTLFRKAADREVPGAQYSLGVMYLTGQGVSADHREAYYWLAIAAAAGDKDAQLRSTAAYMRDQAATKLDREQIAQLNKRIAERERPTPRSP